MGRKANLILVFFVILFVTSCAGRNFVRPEAESLILGKTSHQEIINRFGKPYQEGTEFKNEKTVKTMSYAYATVGGSPLFEGVTPVRAMGFHFLDETLVGYEFLSSFKEDNSYFDVGNINKIKKDETSRDQVIELMGQPSGMYLYPLIKNKDNKAIVYSYTHSKGYRSYKQLLVISLDNNGIVKDVSFTSSGQK
jgi:hypothetical protein